MRISALLPLELSENIVVGPPAQRRSAEHHFNERIFEMGRSVAADSDNHPSLELGLALDNDGHYRPCGQLNQRLT